MGTWQCMKFNFDSCNQWSSYFLYSLHFDTKILVIHKVVLRVHDENKRPHRARKVECGPLATVRLFPTVTSAITIFLTD